MYMDVFELDTIYICAHTESIYNIYNIHSYSTLQLSEFNSQKWKREIILNSRAQIYFFFLPTDWISQSFCGQKDCTKYLLLCQLIPQWWCAICKVSLLPIFTRSLLANPFSLKWYVLHIGMTLAKLKGGKHPYH
ncbi:guanine nucleotide-binding protein subunit beta-4 [Platysternon megacephalum]|uniref:Guanine nucleotide-binding protein subunit beta-4 n=1 Tax=Platysternon megacephalum TaxID=55544 RepID=A0A4D9DY75_9SAUR|nr:guanine nucleotide-binding protein subunit beta-4 [Platysternon megacephalum]